MYNTALRKGESERKVHPNKGSNYQKERIKANQKTPGRQFST